MKKLLCISLSIILATVFLNIPVFSQEVSGEICVFVDQLPVEFDVSPVNREGRVLIPFRAIAEALNVEVDWEDSTKTVLATDATTSISLKIGEKTAFKNKEEITLDVPPTILDGRTLIPIRFFSEAFGCEVLWDAVVKAVRITSPKKSMEVLAFYALGNSKASSWTDLFTKPYPDTAVGNTDIVSELAFGWYEMGEKGNFISNSDWNKPDGWEKVLAAAKKYKIKTEMCIKMVDGNNSLTNLMENAVSVSNAVYNIAEEASLYSGANIDFEGLGLSQRGQELEKVKANFNNFVKLLSEKLKNQGRSLTLTLHAPNSSYKGYDYKTLSQLADKIIIMAHNYGGKPEPENLVIEAVEEAKKEVSAQKLYLAILVESENEDSVKSKIGIAKRYGLKGVSLWKLGVIGDEIWESLKEVIESKPIV